MLSKPISTLGIIIGLCVISPLFEACGTLTKGEEPDETTTNTELPEENEEAKPDFSGDWTPDNGTWKLYITKVNDRLYDVKYYDPATNTAESKVSGPFNLGADGHSIYRDVPYNASNTKEALDAIGKEYRINYSEDGRLYWGGTFYSRNQ